MKLILASRSPFRRKALDILGLEYETRPSSLDEKSIRSDAPFTLARSLSEAKAKKTGESVRNALIIAADLFVVYNNKIYEKPIDENEAYRMLSTFSGNRIDIVSGLAVYNTKAKNMLSTAQKYTVGFRVLLDYEINDYISRYPVVKLAGAFEGDALSRFAESSEGSYPFLTGLPQSQLIQFLRMNGLKV